MFCLRVYTGIVLSSSVFLFNKQFLVLIRTKTVQCIMPTTRHTREPFEEENIFERKKNLHKNWFPFTREKKSIFRLCVCVCVCVYDRVTPCRCRRSLPHPFYDYFLVSSLENISWSSGIIKYKYNIDSHTHTRRKNCTCIVIFFVFFFKSPSKLMK